MSDKISYVSLRAGLVFVLLTLACTTSPLRISSTPVNNPPKLLVLGLDGVPYSTFKKFQDGGHFRNFNAVAPMFASFPSISDPNWDNLFGLGPEPGYTKAFFDPTIKTADGMGEENGTVLAHLSKSPEYERAMDFKPEGPWEHLSTFVWTRTSGKYWLEGLERDFFGYSKAGRTAYFALIINSDLLSHTEGEQSLMNYLAQIEDRVEKIQAHYNEIYHQNLEVVLLSDHGNAFFNPQDIPFQKALDVEGWRLHSTIAGPRDVGFFVPEILSFGAFYCLETSKRDLALTLSKVDKVQSAMYSGFGGEIHIVRAGGIDETILKYDVNKKTLTYKILKGVDPLDQAKFFSKTKPLDAEKYFEKSQEHKFPNALFRIWEGFNINSKTKPQVLVNPEFGWVFGNATLKVLTDLRGFMSSHGSLNREETMGIFVSTLREFPAVRPQDVRKYIPISELHVPPLSL